MKLFVFLKNNVIFILNNKKKLLINKKKHKMHSLFLCQTVFCILAPPFVYNNKNHLYVPSIKSQQPALSSDFIVSRPSVTLNSIRTDQQMNKQQMETIQQQHAIFKKPDINHNEFHGRKKRFDNHLFTSRDYPSDNINFIPITFIPIGSVKIWGEGSESKFPPIFEFIVQRIQAYFSVYKYDDLSRPSTLDISSNDEIALSSSTSSNS